MAEHPSVAGRTDLAYPGEAIRDRDGKIVGCRGLCAGPGLAESLRSTLRQIVHRRSSGVSVTMLGLGGGSEAVNYCLIFTPAGSPAGTNKKAKQCPPKICERSMAAIPGKLWREPFGRKFPEGASCSPLRGEHSSVAPGQRLPAIGCGTPTTQRGSTPKMKFAGDTTFPSGMTESTSLRRD